MNSIILPIEVKVRDFPTRLLLACFSALRSQRGVLIAEESKLLANAKDLPRGNWLFKSISIEDLGSLIDLVKLGYRCFVEDVESGALTTAEVLPQRIDPDALNLTTGFFAWGNYHHRLFRTAFPNQSAKFSVTGAPRYDLLRQPFIRQLSRDDFPFLPQQPYVLFNSSFCTAPVAYQTEDTISRFNRLYAPTEKIADINWKSYLHREAMRPYFIQLLEKAVQQFPGTLFVLRPHPTEDVAKWKSMVKSHDNLIITNEGSVFPWLANASLMIHSGCTTGSEAFAANTPAYFFSPLAEPEEYLKVDGYIIRFNERIREMEQVLERIAEGISGTAAYSTSIREANADMLASLTGTYASEKIASGMLSGEFLTPGPEAISAAESRLERHLANRAEINCVLPSEYLRAKFSGLELTELEKNLAQLARVHPEFANLRAREFGGGIFSIEPISLAASQKQPLGAMPRNEDSPFNRTEPISRVFGLDIGSSIARRYIDRFINEHRQRITGRVLEIGDDQYTRGMGADVTESLVLTANTETPNAILGDLATGKNLPTAYFDCFICTQTLQCIFDMESALANAVACLAPGGTLLLTVSGISQISRYDFDRWGEFWRYTTQGVEKLLRQAAPNAEIVVESRGNLAVAQAYLDGCPADRIADAIFELNDPDYQLVITALLTVPKAPPEELIVASTDNLSALRAVSDHGKNYTVQLGDLRFRTNSLPSLASEFELIFQRHIYAFDAVRKNPLVIDGGAHIGSFTLYTLSQYPDAEVIAFEPENKSWDHLQHNLSVNLSPEQRQRIRTVKKGLAHYDGSMSFDMRDADGSTAFSDRANSTIAVCRLLPYLDRPIDYLKINIEGLELEVLRDIEPKLYMVREICLEYHGFPEVGQRLHEVLDVLHRNGFRYLVHDLGAFFNPVCHPPFRIDATSRYYQIIYARRIQDTPNRL